MNTLIQQLVELGFVSYNGKYSLKDSKGVDHLVELTSRGIQHISYTNIPTIQIHDTIEELSKAINGETLI